MTGVGYPLGVVLHPRFILQPSSAGSLRAASWYDDALDLARSSLPPDLRNRAGSDGIADDSNGRISLRDPPVPLPPIYNKAICHPLFSFIHAVIAFMGCACSTFC